MESSSFSEIVFLILMSITNVDGEAKLQPVSLSSFVFGKLVGVPLAFRDDQVHSQVMEALSLMNSQKGYVADYYYAKESCPDNTDEAISGRSIAKPLEISGRYTKQVVIKAVEGKCTITATMKRQGVASDIAGKTISLTMSATSNAFVWGCHSDIADRYLPVSCIR